METADETVCSPIKTLEELTEFTVPIWASSIIPLKRSKWCASGQNFKCHIDLYEWKLFTRYYRQMVPRTLVCHDFKGGYLDDKYVNGTNNDKSYNFIHWNVIDVFVYFSHYLITIPPYGWINAAHKHGVPILGTIITEFDEGKIILARIIENDQTINNFVESIVHITEHFKLDGWLLNIENEVENIDGLKQFVRELNLKIHKKNPKALIIWYDSVTLNGALKWQNELNENNKLWFDICDGIYLNYNWEKNNLIQTVRMCEHRLLDVYVGIDVFGRNCTGGMDCYKPLEMIRKYGFSVAIFAPGWTYETIKSDPLNTLRKRFEIQDFTFWKSLAPYLYEHGIHGDFFQTTFNTGCGQNYFNLNSQYLPINTLLLGIPNNVEETKQSVEISNELITCKCMCLIDDSFVINGMGLKISNFELPTEGKFIHKIISCDMRMKTELIVVVIYKFLQSLVNFDIVALAQNPNGRVLKIVLKESDNELGTEKQEILHKIFCIKDKINEPWRIKCYKIKQSEIRIFEIGINIVELGTIVLGGLTIQEFPLKNVA